MSGKIYGRIFNERMMKITDKSVGDEQGGFRRGRECVDQIFSFRMVVEKVLAKGKKLYAAFMSLNLSTNHRAGNPRDFPLCDWSTD